MSRPVDVHDLELVARAVRFVARRLEPCELSVDDLEAALVEAAAVESMGATMKVLLAARLAATGAYKATSSSSPQAHVARLTGVGPLTARAQIETGEELGTLDATLQAARSGQLSLGQVQAIVGRGVGRPDSRGRAPRERFASHVGPAASSMRGDHRCRRRRSRGEAQAPAPRPGGAPVPHTRWVQSPPCAIVARGPR